MFEVRNALVAIVLCIAVTAGCRGKNDAPKKAAVQAPDIMKVMEEKEPPSEFQALRDSMQDFVDLLGRCDEYYFADVKGERIKKWALPVDVQKMEKLCDPLLQLHEKMVDEGAWRCPRMDSFLDLSARVADQYLMLAFRSKKIGVKEKKPYIKRVNSLRDGLRKDARELIGRFTEVSRLSDDDLKYYGNVAPDDIPGTTHEVLASLSDAVEEFVAEPISDKWPTWRYSLKLRSTIAERAVEQLRKRAPTGKMALAGPADAVGREFKALVNFFTGAWYYEEEGMDRRVLRKFRKVKKAYDKAAARALKH